MVLISFFSVFRWPRSASYKLLFFLMLTLVCLNISLVVGFCCIDF